MILYSIYDKIADEFGPILEAKNDLVASRGFATVVKPGMEHDYDLYAVGEHEERLSGSPDSVPVIKAYGLPRKVQVSVNYSSDKKLAVVEVLHV